MAIAEVMIPSLLERIQPDKPILASRLKKPKLYPANIPIQSIFTIPWSTGIGNSGCKMINSLHDATTAINKLHAAIAEEETIQLTDFLLEANTIMVTKIVAESPPKNALTKDNCSATAMM